MSDDTTRLAQEKRNLATRDDELHLDRTFDAPSRWSGACGRAAIT